jgi:hypothetical protein
MDNDDLSLMQRGVSFFLKKSDLADWKFQKCRSLRQRRYEPLFYFTLTIPCSRKWGKVARPAL